MLLTDRGAVSDLVADGLAANAIAPDVVRALPFEWSDAAAAELRATHLDGACPDMLIACDCIFQPLFGDSFLLLQMLCALCAPERTVVLIALERRPNDGADAFFAQAASRGFHSKLLLRKERVLVVEMRREADCDAEQASSECET